MKNTKSRKKMLISSVAMLLVALVALGSATYAWFSVSKTVTADSISVKAVATAGLEISIDNENDYDTSKSFTATQASLKPVSWATGSAHGFIPAGNVGSDGAYTATGDGSYTDTGVVPEAAPTKGEAAAKNTYFATYKVWVRSASEDGTETGTRVAHDVQAKVIAEGGSPKSGITFVRAQLVDETTAGNTKVFANTAETTAAISTDTGDTTNVTNVAFGSPQNVTSTDTTTNGKAYTLYVWYEGVDPQCTDALRNGVTNISVEFTATDNF